MLLWQVLCLGRLCALKGTASTVTSLLQVSNHTPAPPLCKSKPIILWWMNHSQSEASPHIGHAPCLAAGKQMGGPCAWMFPSLLWADMWEGAVGWSGQQNRVTAGQRGGCTPFALWCRDILLPDHVKIAMAWVGLHQDLICTCFDSCISPQEHASASLAA